MTADSRRVFSNEAHPHLRVVYHEPGEGTPGFYQFGDRERNTYAGTVSKDALQHLIVALIKEVERE